MTEFVYRGEKIIGIDEPITLENNTDASFNVGVGIIFRKSGLYRVSVDGKHTSVEIEPERKNGKWIIDGHHIKCNRCENSICSRDREGDLIPRNYCPNCGADMRGEQE